MPLSPPPILNRVKDRGANLGHKPNFGHKITRLAIFTGPQNDFFYNFNNSWLQVNMLLVSGICSLAVKNVVPFQSFLMKIGTGFTETRS